LSMGGGIDEQSTEYGGDKDLVDLARECSFALRDTAKWLHRRVEHVHHNERKMVRRKVSVDFSIPKQPALPAFRTRREEEPNTYYVPVALLRKWPPLMEFDLRAETGLPMPLLTTPKNREVDGAALGALAPNGEFVEQLESIAIQDAASAGTALDELGQLLQPLFPELSPEVRQRWRRTLRVAGRLVANSILWVRIEAHPGQRQIVKFSYLEPAPRELIVWRRILSAFSLAPRRAQYELPNLGERGSYHLEIEAPPDLAIYRAKLTLSRLPPLTTSLQTPIHRHARTPPAQRIATRLFRGTRERYRELLGSPEKELPEVQGGEPFERNVGERAHMYVTESQDQYGLATIDLGIGNRALLVSSLMASVVITILLGALWRAPGSLVHHEDAAVALLVIFPALLALLVVRPGEHPITTQLVRGVRFLVIAAAMLPVVDAVILLAFAHPRAGDVRVPFFAVFLVGALLSAALMLSCLLPDATDG
jgi:hypothetical protein